VGLIAAHIQKQEMQPEPENHFDFATSRIFDSISIGTIEDSNGLDSNNSTKIKSNYHT
jgi:hypothetical protein